MTISLIVAMDQNRVIGNKNKLPWHLPADLKHFKELTLSKPIIMGRKTYESIGRPLPGRRNIIVSKQKNFNVSGCEVFSSLEEALDVAGENKNEIMIIGGATIFEQSLPIANRMYLTFIDYEFVGDTFFPKWESSEWHEVNRVCYEPDDRNFFAYCFVELRRVRP